jgi:NADP-dependent 3-hydroxy acid dehydrogenase YdfG
VKTNIENKVILITGASSGIGEATARLLASKGAKVLLGARRTDRLEKIVAEIRAAGGTAECCTLDVTSLEDMKAFVAFAVEKLGPINVLVNNAGIMPLSPLHELKIDEWNRMIDVNVRGVLHGIAAVLPEMRAASPGTSSMSRPLAVIRSGRPAQFTAARSSPCSPSRKDCVWRIRTCG